MPFIEPTRRAKLLMKQMLPEVPGDHCFLAYREMLLEWNESPRWTTADKIYSEKVMKSKSSATLLAWQVFFNLYVMPYELMKRKENGEAR